ncbi:molecular chaperone DnaJ [Prauserella muralis]|uniref:Uncharacterized protein n=1 Tax=Prauserella muralis TaxID=588067 RepID=A0A2V4AND3_9PSEU|nr:molecular chaperone DnaJ [Prauserella muralis]PXY21149.1 hypothetical protein BAY60_27160 [Prauserella muralis]TWE30237.1 hypothetical protein FHX69_2934 [Prauserella muralis]
MFSWRIEPLREWPWQVTKPRLSSVRFRSSWPDTLALLERELKHLGVIGAVVVRACVDAGDIRRDGMLRASARPSQPGVALTFTCRHGELTYACDTYEGSAGHHAVTPGWQANVRAIALSLEALRAVDRHGVAGRGEQYAGWRAIEAAAPDSFATRDEALRWLQAFTDMTELSDVTTLLRLASLRAHPDRGGDPADWRRVDAARQLLKPREPSRV